MESIIYSIKGKDGYYNIIRSLIKTAGPVFSIDNVTVIVSEVKD